ncbi:MAG: cyclic nucleotide-binding domain-containing protein [Polyangiaceae bacterium]
MQEPRATDLFALGKRCFDAIVGELARHGVKVDPALGLRRGDGVMTHYSLPDKKIYLSVPDPSTPVGKLQAMVLASVLACAGESELLSLFELFVPRLIAHEIAHHLRHFHHRFGQSPWEEEQIANRFAAALTRRRMSPAERARAQRLLARTMAALADKIGVPSAHAMSYHDVLFALNADGKIGDTTVERAVVAQRLFDAETQRMLAASEDMPTAVGRDLDLRGALIRDINREYAGDFLKYVYYHAGWLHLDLGRRGAEYVDALAREHLGLAVPLLPVPVTIDAPTDVAVAACYKAFRDCQSKDDVAARYFYKRYRSLLWTRLCEGGLVDASDADVLAEQSAFFLESWDEGASDALKYVAHLATESVRALFPSRLRARGASLPEALPHLACETDARLYRHAALGEPDVAAEQTRLRLRLLEGTDVFRAVPAESLITLAHVLARVHLAAGEVLVWEDEPNDDVFLLASGELSMLVGGKPMGLVLPGKVFGETAFFSRRPRHATVRARVPSECLVIRNLDLLSLAYKHPSILIQMGGAFARRLEERDSRDSEEAQTMIWPRPGE